jgi:carbon-monoxide dehydrogenase medium subunit
VAGNLANAAPSADTAAPLLAYKTSLVLVERGGRRQVELDKFFTGPGATVMEPYELIEAIRIPAPPKRTGSAYQRISARSRVDICAAGVAGFITLDAKENILGARLALAAVAPTPLRCQEAEELLIGKKLSPELTQKAAAACVRAARPIDDLRASAAYRRLMVQVLAQRVIKECLAQAKGTTS